MWGASPKGTKEKGGAGMIVDIVKQVIAVAARVAPEQVGSSIKVSAFLNSRESIFIGDDSAQSTELEAGDGVAIAGQSLPTLYARGTPSVYDITDVIQGAKTFKFLTDASEYFLAGDRIDVVGSTGNDGSYTVASSLFATGKTSVIVEEAIPDSTADGDILHGDKLAILVEA